MGSSQITKPGIEPGTSTSFSEWCNKAHHDIQDVLSWNSPMMVAPFHATTSCVPKDERTYVSNFQSNAQGIDSSVIHIIISLLSQLGEKIDDEFLDSSAVDESK